MILTMNTTLTSKQLPALRCEHGFISPVASWNYNKAEDWEF